MIDRRPFLKADEQRSDIKIKNVKSDTENIDNPINNPIYNIGNTNTDNKEREKHVDYIYTNSLFKEYKERSKTELKNICKQFEETCIQNSYKDFLGSFSFDGKGRRVLSYLTYAEVFDRVRALTCFINSICNKKNERNKGNLIGMCCKNSPEWLIIDHSIMRSRNITVPLYMTFGIDSINNILKETELDFLFIDSERIDVIDEFEREIGTVVVIPTPSDINNSKINREKVDEYLKRSNVFNIHEVISEYMAEIRRRDHMNPLNNNNSDINNIHNTTTSGTTENNLENNIEDNQEIDLNDLATICYTSGTSALPKGVEITHKNISSVMLGYRVSTTNNQQYSFTDRDVYVSYLPMAHILERMILFALCISGSKIAFHSGVKKDLVKEFALARPTFIAGVPKVFENIRQQIYKNIPRPLRFLFSYFLNRKKRVSYIKEDVLRRIGERLFFNKVKEGLGGNVKFFISGSAPLSEDLHSFIENVFGCDMLQGYGLTETMSSVFMSNSLLHNPGTVGIPFAMCEVLFKYDGVVNMWELYVRGDNVSKGYYRNPELTAEVFNQYNSNNSEGDNIKEEGWFRTGDYGEFRNGLIRIVGRTRNSFKTSLGEFICPDRIEVLFETVFTEIYVTGNPFKSHLVCIVSDRRIKSEGEAMELIKKHADLLKRKGILYGFQVPRAVHLVDKSFMDLGLLNVTGKVVRERVEVKFREVIDRMLESHLELWVR